LTQGEKAQWLTQHNAQLEAFRKKRNIGDYERAGVASKTGASEMVALAQRLRQEVGNWLQANHPELL
jgi:hypothetical protein